MNIIFLDFDGVIDTNFYKTDEQIKNKIKIVSNIAKYYNCKIVIEAAAKETMDEESLEITGDWCKFVVDNLKDNGVEVIGRTPSVGRSKKINNHWADYVMWKEYEIIQYLVFHPEIEHFVIFDDDDLNIYNNSDLNMLREHLLKTESYNPNNPDKEGILMEHIPIVGEILKKENKYKSYSKINDISELKYKC